MKSIKDKLFNDVEYFKNIIEEYKKEWDCNVEKVWGGNGFTCCCPFHQEKTPSFFISLKTHQYYCFGCGEKGDINDLLKSKSAVKGYIIASIYYSALFPNLGLDQLFDLIKILRK